MPRGRKWGNHDQIQNKVSLCLCHFHRSRQGIDIHAYLDACGAGLLDIPMEIGVNGTLGACSQHHEGYVVCSYLAPVDLALPSGYVDTSCKDVLDGTAVGHLIHTVYLFPGVCIVCDVSVLFAPVFWEPVSVLPEEVLVSCRSGAA